MLESKRVSHPTGLEPGCRICAVGDIHGRSLALKALLDQFRRTNGHHDRTCLVLLGDLIDRGPDSIGALDTVLEAKEQGAFDGCIALMGNHEQMIRLVLRGRVDMDPHIWIWNDWGGTVLKALDVPVPPDIFARGSPSEIRAVNEELAGRLGAALGQRRLALLEGLVHHHFAGKLLFVHAGIDPDAGLHEFLDLPWDLLEDDHWAWIRGRFLRRPVPHPDLTVVHGHSPVRRSRPWMLSQAAFAPHHQSDGKINLDAGSFLSGCVAGAEFTTDGYRLWIACEER